MFFSVCGISVFFYMIQKMLRFQMIFAQKTLALPFGEKVIIELFDSLLAQIVNKAYSALSSRLCWQILQESQQEWNPTKIRLCQVNGLRCRGQHLQVLFLLLSDTGSLGARYYIWKSILGFPRNHTALEQIAGTKKEICTDIILINLPGNHSCESINNSMGET